jgi:serine/threonine protein phosphatase PrpC
MPEWAVESSQLSDTGRKRLHNEDYVACYEPTQPAALETRGRIYVLADGVGGGAAGEVASEYTVKRIISHYYSQDKAGVATTARLLRAVKSTNAEVFAQNMRRADQREMATTVVAAVIRGDQLTVANVGDSRAYLVAGQTIKQITHDHSLVAEMVREGTITSTQAESHPYRNVILRSVGSQPVVKVDIFSHRITPQDNVVLCSDGLTRRVADQEIAQVVSANPPAQAAYQLIALANERGGDDNITVSITRITDRLLETPPAGADQPPPVPRWEDFQSCHGK